MKPEAALCCTPNDGICERPAGGMSRWKRRAPCQRSCQGTQFKEEKDDDSHQTSPPHGTCHGILSGTRNALSVKSEVRDDQESDSFQGPASGIRSKRERMFRKGRDLPSLLPLLVLAALCDAFSPPTILMIKGGCIRPQGRAWTRGSGGRVAESISMQDGKEKGERDFSAGKGKGGITRRDAVLGFGLSFVPAVSSREMYKRISTTRIPLATQHNAIYLIACMFWRFHQHQRVICGNNDFPHISNEI
jgi:hypothetical protein